MSSASNSSSRRRKFVVRSRARASARSTMPRRAARSRTPSVPVTSNPFARAAAAPHREPKRGCQPLTLVQRTQAIRGSIWIQFRTASGAEGWRNSSRTTEGINIFSNNRGSGRSYRFAPASKTEAPQTLTLALQVFERIFLEHLVCLQEFVDLVAGFKSEKPP